MWGRGAWERLDFCAVAAIFSAAALAVPAFMSGASAQTVAEAPDETKPDYGWREVYGGVDAAPDQWLA